MLEGQPFTPARGLFPNPAASLRGLPGGAPLDATNPPGRLAQFMRMLDYLDSNEIGLAIDGMIARLDAQEGDPDLEANGDELDCSESHEEGVFPGTAEEQGAGCHISDPGGGDANDTAGDLAWPEWDQRAWRRKVTTGGYEDRPREIAWFGSSEDDEEDDPAEDGDEDRCLAGDDHMTSGPVFARDQWATWSTDGRAAGDEADNEANQPPTYAIDQSADLFVTAANDWPDLRRSA